MEKIYIVGVDFGHGETSAWLVPINEACTNNNSYSLRIRNGAHANDKVCPSWVYLKNGKYSLTETVGSVIRYGFKAKPAALNQDLKQKEAFAAYVKLIIQALLQYNTELKIEDGDSNFILCVACPTRWLEADRRDYLGFLTQALGGVSVEPLWVINESDAAFFSWGNTSACTLVIDYGSSTIDYTVMRDGKKVSDDRWSNPQLGANLVERGIVNDYKESNFDKYQNILNATIQECDRTGNPQYDAEEIGSFLITDTRAAKENVFKNATWPQLSRMSFSMFDRCGGYDSGYDEDAPVMKVGGSLLSMPSFISYQDAVKQDFEQLKVNIDNTVGRNTLTRIILSGGACLMTWVRPMVKQVFGQDVEIVMDNEPAYVVSKGIAYYTKAQLEALRKLRQEVSQIDYSKLYSEADRIVTADTIEKLSDRLKTTINGLSGPNAHDINYEFRNFLFKMDGSNEEYREVFSSEISRRLSTMVFEKLNMIVNDYFNRNIEGSIDLDFEPSFTVFREEAFDIGGRIDQLINGWIKSSAIACGIAWDTDFINSFNWDKPRYGSEKDQLFNGTLSRMMNWLRNDTGSITYASGVLENAADELKKKVLQLSEQLFYEQQLFKTTFVG